MARGSDIKARLGLESKGAEQALERCTGKLAGLGKVKGPLMAAGAIAAVGTAAAVAGAKAFQATAQLELGANKIAVVFGNQLPKITQWADSVRLSMGTTRQETLMLAAGFQDLLVPMGFSREEAAKLTTETVGLSAALSEWSGGTKTAAEIASIFSKAMLGEREQMKTLGISITELDVKTKLLARGQEKLTGNALAQAKAIATQELIFEKSTDAQEAFRKGGDSLARTQQELSATINQIKEDMLIALIPAMVEIGAILKDDVIPQIKILGQWFGDELPSKIATTVESLRTLSHAYKITTGSGEDLRESEQIRVAKLGLDIAQPTAKLGMMLSPFSALNDVAKSVGFDGLDMYFNKMEDLTEQALEAAVEIEGLADQSEKLAEMSALAKAEQAKYTQSIVVQAETVISLAQKQANELAGIAELFKEELKVVTDQIAADLEALNNRLAEGNQDYRDKMLKAMVADDTERLNFLKENNQKIQDNAVAMMDKIRAAGFSNADMARIDIIGILTDELWQRHLDGVKAAIAEEERLRQERYSQAMRNADDTQKLALAITESIRIAQREGTYDPTQTQEMYRYAGLRGQLQQWMRTQDGSGFWGAYGGGMTDQPIPLEKAHNGGRIGGPIGQETPIMALGGETVLPIGASQGVTINFNGLVAGDPVAIGREIANIVNKSSRANGAIINSSAVTS